METNKIARATAMLALATFGAIGSGIIYTVAKTCGLKTSDVQEIVDEIMAAKEEAERAMALGA